MRKRELFREGETPKSPENISNDRVLNGIGEKRQSEKNPKKTFDDLVHFKTVIQKNHQRKRRQITEALQVQRGKE